MAEEIKPACKLLSKYQDWEGKAYRVDIDNWGIPRSATVGDVIRFERDELGNEIGGLNENQLKELDQFAARDVIWVCKKKIHAKEYEREGAPVTTFSKDFLTGGKILFEDGCEGYLVLFPDAVKAYEERCK